MSAEIEEQLCSSSKLDRDKAYADLQKIIENLEPDGISELQSAFRKRLTQFSDKWESRHGALSGVKALLHSGKCDDDFAIEILDQVLTSLDDSEFRVRIVAGEILGILCSKLGSQIYGHFKSQIMEGIRSNLERQPLLDSVQSDHADADKLIEKLSTSPGSRRASIDAAQIFHDTAGWKSLETYMRCLESVIAGCGFGFNEYVDQELLDLIFSALMHTNRFVRETGFYVCSSLVSCGAKEGSELDSEAKLVEENAIYRHGQEFAEHLGRGLADNWSQVRLAGAVASRHFLLSLPSESAREKFYPVLIPRLCLNRYYVAEGVRLYSQETWRLVTKGVGKTYVEKYIDQTVDYYIEATDSDNHSVREAACSCIAELGSKSASKILEQLCNVPLEWTWTSPNYERQWLVANCVTVKHMPVTAAIFEKIDNTAVRPHVARLLETLLICFNDDSWPVRDAACVACGNFILCFPEESKESLPALYPLFFNNLQDNIPSVRQGAAIALLNVVKAYGGCTLEVILGKIREGFEGLENQPATSEKYSNMDKGPATYSVAKQLRDNDMELHTDKQMYSCGSLAPRMGRGRDGGCKSYKFRKPSEPWELADGCVSLLAELSHISTLASEIVKLLPLLVKACNKRHYTHHLNFLETVFKQLPNIAKGLGKRHFKSFLEAFFEPLFYSLESDNALASAAASQCLTELSHFIGEGIMRGRVEQYDPNFLRHLNTCLEPPVV